ncbi:MAG: hypothetical protein P8129_09790 [Anaerolineae bacterium]|jgi:hypothetical protein
MKSLQDAVRLILARPTPEALIELQGELLVLEDQGRAVEPALQVTGHFYTYLSELRSKVVAQEYSEMASRLDIGAVGTVAVENLVAGEGADLWKRLLLGAVGEGLMVAASRQYVEGWKVEAGLVHSQASWYLGQALWRASRQMQPDLAPEGRRQAIERLLAPARDPDTPAAVKTLLIGRIFQLLLLGHVSHLLPAPGEGS